MKDTKQSSELFKESKEEDGNLGWFSCVKCNGIALATNGALLLPQPQDPMGLLGLQKVDVNFLFCPACDILENMDNKTIQKATEVDIRSTDDIKPSPEHVQLFHQRILDYLG